MSLNLQVFYNNNKRLLKSYCLLINMAIILSLGESSAFYVKQLNAVYEGHFVG